MQPSPAQRAAKVHKMAGYLGTTHEKVDSLVKGAFKEGADPDKVKAVSQQNGPLLDLRLMDRQAMQPLLEAVDKALNYYHNQYNVRKSFR